MVKKKEPEQFSNRTIIIIILAVAIIMPFMYYIGFPWISDVNDKAEHIENITKECFIEYAKEYCTNNNMTFDRTVHDWGNFYCLDDKELRETGRPTRFYFTVEELKYCNSDVKEVQDE